jgi:hypothetical protein
MEAAFERGDLESAYLTLNGSVPDLSRLETFLLVMRRGGWMWAVVAAAVV